MADDFDPDAYLEEVKKNPNSEKSQPNSEPNESLRGAWEHLKKGELAKAAMSVPGQDWGRSLLGGELGPLNGPVAAGIATVSPLAGAGGSWMDRFHEAQKEQREAMARHPGAAMLGGVASGIAAPLPGINGGASVLGKGAAGAVNGALQGGATSAGLGQGVGPGALVGGAVGGVAGTLGGLLSKAANSETLSPLLNRLKFLKPSPEEAQPLSQAGGDIRNAINDTAAQGLWKGLPSREGMLGRLQEAQAPAGKRIGDILSHADEVNANPAGPQALTRANGAPPGMKVQPDLSFPQTQGTIKDLLSHSAASNANPARLQNIAEQEGQNVADASGSLAALNKAKQGIYNQAYTPNTPDMGESFLPGRDQLLRSMGRDVKNSVQGSLDNLHNIDPSVDAEGFSQANKQYGTLADLIGPLNRGIGKDIAGEHGGGNVRIGTTGHAYGGLGDLLNLGGKRYLAQAHAGEALQSLDKGLSVYKPSQAVAKAFVVGTTPGLNQEDEETSLENQP